MSRHGGAGGDCDVEADERERASRPRKPPPARRDDALDGAPALLRRAQQHVVRCQPGVSAGSLARRWLTELRTNRPRRFAAAEVAGRLAGLAGLPRALRERRAIQGRRTATADEIAALLRAPR
ncbi:MAG: hypothetical protein WKF96_12775 [Solirubrobacteraceae bacterium]